MLAMSVNDVPGWLVTIAPSGIGVPVAFTPGLVPHEDVLTLALVELVELEPVLAPCGVLAALELLLLLDEPHPASATAPATATTTLIVLIRPTC